VPRKLRVANPFVTAIICVLAAALGVFGGGLTIGAAAVISGMRETARYVFTESYRSPAVFVALCAVAVVAACFWIRRLLRPRPPWALSLAFAYVAAVVVFVVMALRAGP
jgi:amino acid transporter